MFKRTRLYVCASCSFHYHWVDMQLQDAAKHYEVPPACSVHVCVGVVERKGVVALLETRGTYHEGIEEVGREFEKAVHLLSLSCISCSQ